MNSIAIERRLKEKLRFTMSPATADTQRSPGFGCSSRHSATQNRRQNVNLEKVIHQSPVV